MFYLVGAWVAFDCTMFQSAPLVEATLAENDYFHGYQVGHHLGYGDGYMKPQSSTGTPPARHTGNDEYDRGYNDGYKGGYNEGYENAYGEGRTNSPQ